MGRDRQQDPRLVERVLARLVVADRPDLERHDAAVLTVQRLDHARLSAGAERLQDLVALLDQRRHPLAPFTRVVVFT